MVVVGGDGGGGGGGGGVVVEASCEYSYLLIGRGGFGDLRMRSSYDFLPPPPPPPPTVPVKVVTHASYAQDFEKAIALKWHFLSTSTDLEN